MLILKNLASEQLAFTGFRGSDNSVGNKRYAQYVVADMTAKKSLVKIPMFGDELTIRNLFPEAHDPNWFDTAYASDALTFFPNEFEILFFSYIKSLISESFAQTKAAFTEIHVSEIWLKIGSRTLGYTREPFSWNSQKGFQDVEGIFRDFAFPITSNSMHFNLIVRCVLIANDVFTFSEGLQCDNCKIRKCNHYGLVEPYSNTLLTTRGNLTPWGINGAFELTSEVLRNIACSTFAFFEACEKSEIEESFGIYCENLVKFWSESLSLVAYEKPN